jgi:hypothetical protein
MFSYDKTGLSMASEGTSVWLPEREPTRLEIAITAMALVYAVWIVLTETISWGWLVAGFITTAFAMGPVAASAIGARIGEWFRAIGVGGRAVAIITFAAVVWTADAVLGISETPAMSFSVGIFYSTATVIAIKLAQRVASHS